MDLIASFVRNPVKISVGVLLTLLFGGLALYFIPIQLIPDVSRPVIRIQTMWPGASPQEVEREIVQPQEEQLKGVEGVEKMSSESTDSMASVVMEFEVGTDTAVALLKVNSKLQQVSDYPEDATEPVIATSAASDRPVAWMVLRPRVATTEALRAFQAQHPELREALEPAVRARSAGLRARRLETAAQEHPELASIVPKDLDIPTFRTFAEDMIEARIERVGGVSDVEVFGGREEELQIIVDPRRLAARKITIPQLRTALRVRNHNVSAGDFWEGKRRYVVRTLGQYKSPQEVEGVLVARRDDVPVYVRDVAEVKLGYKKARGEVYNFGRRCIAMNAQRATGANVLHVMEGVRGAIDELNAGVLKDRDLQIDVVYDETGYIVSARKLVVQNILIGGLLTTLVLLLFLRSVRPTLVVSLAIPTSVIGTFLLLGLMGRSINVVSLAGMAFAVGMLVDNAIVVLENIVRWYQKGERRFVAAVKGTQEVWGAIIASTLTTLAVFIPILFLEDEVGQLFGDIAVAISCAVGLSLLVSVTVIPTAAARILPKRNRAGEDRGEDVDAAPDDERLDINAFVPRWLRPIFLPFDLVGRGFTGALLGIHRVLERGWLRQVAFCAVLIGLAVWLSIALLPKREYLPAGNQNLAIAIIFPPPGYNLEEMRRIGETIDQRIRPYWDSDEARKVDDPDYAAIEQYFFVAYGRQLFMGAQAMEAEDARKLVGLLNRSVQGVPGAFAIAAQMSLFADEITSGRSIDVELRGPDLHHLVALGGRVYGQLKQLFPSTYPRPIPSLDLSSPEVHVVPRWERAADLGVTALDLGYTVNAYIDGAYAGDFFTGGDEIDLTIVGQERYASRLQDLKDLPVATPTGNLVPLGALATIELSSGPEQINRRERERTITIQLVPPETVPLEEAVELVEKNVVEPLRNDGSLMDHYRVTMGGTADKLKTTLEEVSWNLALALAITYLLMAGLFESWLYPLVVIVSVPLGAVGGFLGLIGLNLFILGPRGEFQPLDMLTMIGFVILIGTVVNNAILIVHQALTFMARDQMTPNDAVLRSIRSRVRPIFMTLFTTVFGLAPLVVFPGAGSELYRGIGSVLLGGLLVSTFFTLLLVPTLFRVLMSTRALVGRLLGRPAVG